MLHARQRAGLIGRNPNVRAQKLNTTNNNTNMVAKPPKASSHNSSKVVAAPTAVVVSERGQLHVILIIIELLLPVE